MRNLGDERNAVFFNFRCDTLLTPRFSERFLKSCSEARLDRSWRRRFASFSKVGGLPPSAAIALPFSSANDLSYRQHFALAGDGHASGEPGLARLCVSNSQFSRENPPHLCGVSPMWNHVGS